MMSNKARLVDGGFNGSRSDLIRTSSGHSRTEMIPWL